jgi:hypothetical protein
MSVVTRAMRLHILELKVGMDQNLYWNISMFTLDTKFNGKLLFILCGGSGGYHHNGRWS